MPQSLSRVLIHLAFTYIKNQARQHQKMTFQEEYRRFLERHQAIAYDERYVWD